MNQFDPYINDESKKYVCSYILRRIMEDDEWVEYLPNSFLVAGAIAVSDNREDHAILDFFQDVKEVTDFIMHEIVVPTEQGKLTEEFLAELACQRKNNDLVFVNIPFVLSGINANVVVEAMHTRAETIDFVFQDTNLKDFLEI